MKLYIKPQIKTTNSNLATNIMWNSIPPFGPGWEEDDDKNKDKWKNDDEIKEMHTVDDTNGLW